MEWKNWIKDFFRPAEKRLFDRVNDLFDLSFQANELILPFFLKERSLEEVRSMAHKVAKLEREGDKITRSLDIEISSGSLAPPLLEDFKRIVEYADEVLDKLHFMARELNRGIAYVKLMNEVEAKVYSLIGEILKKGKEANIKMRKLLVSLGYSIEEAREIARDIEALEEEVDEIKNMSLDIIYSSPQNFLIFHHLLQLTMVAESILDIYEDISDLSISLVKALIS
ncbi:MAG: DUF47 family protein [Nitrososphaerales archaeon]